MRVPVTIAGQTVLVEMTPEELAAYQKAAVVPPTQAATPHKAPAPAPKKAAPPRATSPDEAAVPSRADLKEFILGQSNWQHSMGTIFEEFAGGPVPSQIEKDGKKANSPVYARWKHHADAAREEIENEQGVKFSSVNNGGKVTYFVEGS